MRIVANDSEFDIEENIALLPALQQHGICAQFSCRNGNCGLCEAGLNAGRVWLDDRRQLVEAPATVLLCRAFARSDLALSVNVVPRAVSRYCRVRRFEKIDNGYEVELQLPAGRMPVMLADDSVRLEGCMEARVIKPRFVSMENSLRVLVLQLFDDDREWLEAIGEKKGVRIELPVGVTPSQPPP